MTMIRIATINHPDPTHLAAVRAEMLRLGAPTVRVVRDEAQGLYLALEGSHRLAAARELGIVPILQVIPEDELISCEEIGYDDCGWFEGEPARVGDIRDRIASPMGTYAGCPILTFEEVRLA